MCRGICREHTHAVQQGGGRSLNIPSSTPCHPKGARISITGPDSSEHQQSHTKDKVHTKDKQSRPQKAPQGSRAPRRCFTPLAWLSQQLTVAPCCHLSPVGNWDITNILREQPQPCPCCSQDRGSGELSRHSSLSFCLLGELL